MTYQVIITPAAEQDIGDAVAWWHDHRSAAQAEQWYEKIKPAIATLAENPDRCPIAPETDLYPTGLRQLHFGLSRKPVGQAPACLPRLRPCRRGQRPSRI